ncbi:MAG TPA: hypothetical protein PKL75_04645 [Treponemataceae bacterium]|nr:hypothetical protein [Treponemataceae bacterium]
MKTSRVPAILCALLLAGGLASADAPRVIRVPVWVFLEPVPGKGFPVPQGDTAATAATNGSAGSVPAGAAATEGTPAIAESSGPPAKDLRELARFVLGGMVYGWRFSYTPSDRTRRVDESFTLEPIAEIPDGDPRFSLSGFDPAYPRVSTWAEFLLDDATARRNLYWKSVQFRSADGRGYGDRERESAGIRDAYSDAVRTAVRAYARKLEKNKPKEIRGEVLLKDNPRLFTEAGRFVADITVLVNLIEIVPYSTF